MKYKAASKKLETIGTFSKGEVMQVNNNEPLKGFHIKMKVKFGKCIELVDTTNLSYQEVFERIEACFAKLQQVRPELDIQFEPKIAYEPGWASAEFYWSYISQDINCEGHRFSANLNLDLDLIYGNEISKDDIFEHALLYDCGGTDALRLIDQGMLVTCFLIYKRSILGSRTLLIDYLHSLCSEEHWKKRDREIKNARRRELYHQKKLQKSLQP